MDKLLQLSNRAWATPVHESSDLSFDFVSSCSLATDVDYHVFTLTTRLTSSQRHRVKGEVRKLERYRSRITRVMLEMRFIAGHGRS